MLRLLTALPIALLISYALIAVMAWMVDLNKPSLDTDKDGLQFDMFMVEQEQETQRMTRKLPDPPTLKPVAPKAKPTQPAQPQTMTTPSFESLPDINMDLAVSGMNIAIPSNNINDIQQTANTIASPNMDIGESQQVMPLHRTEAVYPPKARQRRIEGYIILSFDIDKRGQPKNIEVVESKPPRIFTREAIKALRHWKYQPRIVNGQAQEQRGQKVKLEFKLR